MSSVADQHSAAASFAGFLFQLDLALLALVKSKVHGHVGVETLDDVVVQEASGEKILGQSKLSYRCNPVPDRSTNLWKTFSIWLRMVENDECDLDQTEFHLISNHEIKTGFVAALKSSVSTEPTKLARQLRTLAKSASGAIKPFAATVIKCSEPLLAEFLSRVRIVDAVPSKPSAQIPLFAAELHLPLEIAPAVIRGVRGWIQESVEEKFALKEPAWLSHEEFSKVHADLIVKHHDRRFLLRTVEQIVVKDSDRQAQQSAVFVEQLRWIGISEASDEMLDAINDFLRGRAERTRLADNNNVSKVAFRGFEENLVAHWKRVHRRVSDILDEEDEHAGRQILRETVDRPQYLDGQPVTEDYLTCGTYHELANTRSARVGWHPQFRQRLTEWAKKTPYAHDGV